MVTVKGRAAAELSLGDELVLSDLLFTGALQGLDGDQLAALLSCFVWRERREAGGKVGVVCMCTAIYVLLYMYCIYVSCIYVSYICLIYVAVGMK